MHPLVLFYFYSLLLIPIVVIAIVITNNSSMARLELGQRARDLGAGPQPTTT